MAVTREKKRRLNARKRTADAKLLEAISRKLSKFCAKYSGSSYED